MTEVYDLRGIEDAAKYDRLVQLESAGAWWNPKGPHGGLHLLNQVRVPYFARILGGYAGKRILEIGCGGGIFAEEMAKAGASVVGIDPSKASIDVAREHASSQGLHIDYRIAYAEDLELEEEFDAVMAVDVLEHVDDVDATLASCARALGPGGIFCFLTHNQTLEAFEFLIWQGEYQLGFIPLGTHDFHKFIRPDHLQDRLARCGMAVAEVQGLECDIDAGKVLYAEEPTISYMGYAVRS